MEQSDKQLTRAAGDFFEHLRKVLKHRSSKVAINALKRLNQFQRAYKLLTADEFRQIVEKFFKAHRSMIIGGDITGAWLRSDKSVEISLDREVKIMLSAAYKAACRYREEAERGLESDPEAGAEELNFPDLILLYLYRLLKECVTAHNCQKRLQEIVNDLEEELALSVSESEIKTEKESKGERKTDKESKQNMPMPGFDQIGNIAKGIFASMGMSNMPDMKEMEPMLNSIFGSSAMKDTFGSVAEKIATTGDIGSAMQMMLSKLGDPTLTQTISQTLNSAQSSSQSSGQMGPVATAAQLPNLHSLSLTPAPTGQLRLEGAKPE